MTISLVTGRGRTLELGRRLDSGGEGVVYEVPGSPLVAKLLIDPGDPADLARRLAILVRLGRSPRTARLLAGEPRRAAWPVDTVRAARPARPDGPSPEIHGYLMPDMRRWFEPLDWWLSARLRAERFPGATWGTALGTAASLARLVADVHAAGCVIGDLKPGNLWADAQGNTGISDVDSFQFGNGAGFFPSRSCTPDYTAPERIDNPGAPASEASDDFVLAVVIYQLLMDGMHPFFGMPADGTRYVSIEDNIVRGRCRLLRPDSVRPIPGAPPLWTLPWELYRLACRSFGAGSRPTADEWAAALDSERAPGRLRHCPASTAHVHSAESPRCPWCAATALPRIPRSAVANGIFIRKPAAYTELGCCARMFKPGSETRT